MEPRRFDSRPLQQVEARRVLRGPTLGVVATFDQDGRDYAALGLAVAGDAAIATVFIPDLYQEATTANLVIWVGLLLLVCAVVLVIGAGRAQRRPRHWVAGIALIVSAIPLLLLLIQMFVFYSTSGCLIQDCGGGG